LRLIGRKWFKCFQNAEIKGITTAPTMMFVKRWCEEEAENEVFKTGSKNDG
jgi:hypothetical protein